jgi:hypothetical protein
MAEILDRDSACCEMHANAMFGIRLVMGYTFACITSSATQNLRGGRSQVSKSKPARKGPGRNDEIHFFTQRHKDTEGPVIEFTLSAFFDPL